MLIFVFIIFLIFIYIYQVKLDKFNDDSIKSINLGYPYNPKIHTPNTNYLDITNKIKSQQKYKKNMSIALNPIPVIQCNKLKNKNDCNTYGCNWFGNLCSSMYPIDY